MLVEFLEEALEEAVQCGYDDLESCTKNDELEKYGMYLAYETVLSYIMNILGD